MDFWDGLSHVADILAVVAAMAAALGAFTAWLARPKVTIQPVVSPPQSPFGPVLNPTGLIISVDNLRGSRAANNLEWIWEGLNDRGDAKRGTGELWKKTLQPGEGLALHLYLEGTELGYATNDNDVALSFVSGEGMLAIFRWQHPVLPWLKEWAVVRWTREARETGKQPVVLRGVRAWRAFRSAHRWERRKS